jgi:hypothetical protein
VEGIIGWNDIDGFSHRSRDCKFPKTNASASFVEMGATAQLCRDTKDGVCGTNEGEC